MKKFLIILVNALLVLIIAGVILATWMPAIYTSEWFAKTDWPSVYATAGRLMRWGLGAVVVLAVVWVGGAVWINRRRRAETPATIQAPPSRGFPSR